MKIVVLLACLTFLPFVIDAQTIQQTPTSLSGEMAGEYVGTFARNGVLQEKVTVIVKRKGDDRVQISAGAGVKMKTFKARLQDTSLSALRRIGLSAVTKVEMKEGMMTPENGRLSFSVSYPDGTLDVFSGIRVGHAN